MWTMQLFLGCFYDEDGDVFVDAATAAAPDDALRRLHHHYRYKVGNVYRRRWWKVST